MPLTGMFGKNRWDSSDPERNPPPLPLHPSTPGSSPTRAGTSANVAAAAQALVGRAREALSNNAYMREISPEKSPGRSPQHRRLQSIQSLEGATQSERHASRTTTPMSPRDALSGSSDIDSPPGIPTANELFRDSPALRPSTRQLHRPLFGENTPPSATVRAIQNMSVRDHVEPFSDTTNSSNTQATSNLDKLHAQIMNLTTIATTLQKEMTALSRRSKDNATDLVSLKEATNTRDEDIRKSLKELVHSMRASETSFSNITRGDGRPNSSMGFGAASVDDKSIGTAPFSRSVFLPKIPSIHGFDDSDRLGPGCPHSIDGAANLAMLEKIIREMGTKEGQERVMQSLTEFAERHEKDSSKTHQSIEDLTAVLQAESSSQALVKPQSSNAFASDKTASDIPFIHEGLSGLMEQLKDGIHQSGGMTNEVKSLVRELRGEVLGMGRELGSKLEKLDHPPLQQQDHLIIADKTKSEVEKVINKGLADLREHMDEIIQSKQMQLTTTAAENLNSKEVYDVVKYALDEGGLATPPNSALSINALDRDSILSAVKEAYEAYKPEIELQQFGLERDEILQCLREGLEDYRSAQANAAVGGPSREDIMESISLAIQHFTPPSVAPDLSNLKHDVLEAVQSYMSKLDSSRVENDRRAAELTRQDVIGVIGESLETLKDNNAQHLNTSRDVLMQAVKSAIESTSKPFNGNGEQVLESLRQIISSMWEEVKQYSTATNQGNDRVANTMKDGLERLRVDIQSYVDRAQDVTGKDEIVQTIREGLEDLHNNMAGYMSSARGADQAAAPEMVDYIKSEFEHLHEAIHARSSPGYDSIAHKEEILVALAAGFAAIEAKSHDKTSVGLNDELLESIKMNVDQLKTAVITGAATSKSDTVEAIQQSMTDILDQINLNFNRDATNRDISSSIKEELAQLRETLAVSVQQPGPSTHTAEALCAVTEALDNLRAQLASDQTEAMTEVVARVEQSLDVFRESIAQTVSSGSVTSSTAEILDAIRQGPLPTGTRAIYSEDHPRSTEALENIQSEMEFLRQSISKALVQGAVYGNNDELFDALRLGFVDVKAYLEGRLPASDMAAPRFDEMLAAVNQSLDDFRIDVAKLTDQPAGLHSSGTIMVELKNSLVQIQADLHVLRSQQEYATDGEVVLAGDELSRGMPKQPSKYNKAGREDLERVELMITQLQVKVEALSREMHALEVEPLLHEVQETIKNLSEQQSAMNGVDVLSAVNDMTSKFNQALPTMEAAASKDQLDTVEAVARLTNESVDGLVSRFDEKAATKDDIALLESLLHDIALPKSADNSVYDSRVDLAAIGIVCAEIKTNLAALPLGSIQKLNEMLASFKHSHESMEKRYENDIGVTAKAFDDRKNEAREILEQLEDVKILVNASKDEIKSRMKRSNEDVRALDEILQGIEDKIDGSNALTDVQALAASVTQEFEATHKALEDVKSDNEAHATAISAAHAALHAGLIAEFATKLGEFSSQQDNHHATTQRTTDLLAERASQQDDLLAESRTMAEELKVTIDTLGKSVTALVPSLTEATNKISDDAKTVFTRIEELHAKVDETSAVDKSQHELTRDGVLKTLSAIDTLHEQASSFHPKFFDLLTALSSTVAQHFEHSRNFQDTVLQDKASDRVSKVEVPLLPTMAVSAVDDNVHDKLDELLKRELTATVDTSGLHSKLDALLSAPTPGPDTMEAHFKKMEDMHSQLLATAADVSAMLAFQSKLANATSNSRETEPDLSGATNSTESMEVSILAMRQVKEEIEAQVNGLKADRDTLQAQKLRLTGEVSSLQTAMDIRREELQVMDARADALERRIIEGIMDHSRALLITKKPKSGVDMNLKRVHSNNSRTVSKTFEDPVNTAFGIAVKSRPASRRSVAPTNPAGRRILSLSQITGNARSPQGLAVSPQSKDTGLDIFKRNQAFKSAGIRKSSWAGRPSAAAFDKENEILDEESDGELDGKDYDVHSTDYTSSYLGDDRLNERSVLSTNSRSSYGTGSSEYTYGTGSYFTGSDTGRSLSAGSTVRSAVDLDHAVHEDSEEIVAGELEDDSSTVGEEVEEQQEDEEEEEGVDVEVAQAQIVQYQPMEEAMEGKGQELTIVRRNGYDSGLGSDCPTADLQAMIEGDYFERAPDEA